MNCSHYLSNYTIESEVGQGSFATVYLGRELKSDAKVAIKAVSLSKLNKKLAENLASEISILKGIDHPNIVKLFEIQKTDTFIYLIMEYCDAGDLSQYLRKYRVLPESQAQQFLIQLSNALQIIWENNLIHRDIKPQNLLLSNENGNLVLKLADFGFARTVQPLDLAETLCGSPLYMAPEILKYEKYDSKADLWSVGTILFEMLFGSPPFKGENHVHLLRVIEAADDENISFPATVSIRSRNSRSQGASSMVGTRPVSTTLHISVSETAKDLIRKLLIKDPAKRLGFPQFFEHPFLANRFHQAQRIICRSESLKHSRTPSAVSCLSLLSTEATLNSLLSHSIESDVLLESLLSEINENIPVFSTIRSALILVLIFDQIASAESSGLLSQTLTMSISKYSGQSQRLENFARAITILYYIIDLLESIYNLIKLSLTKDDAKSKQMIKAKWVSWKMDQMFELVDALKRGKKQIIFGSSLSRSTSSTSIGFQETGEELDFEIEDIIFKFSCSTAKDAGIQELLENYHEAASMYNISNHLLSFLATPPQMVPVSSALSEISVIDPELTSKFKIIQDKISDRIESIQNKVST